MKKIILSAMVAAAAVFGAYTASQTSDEVASMGLLDATDIEAEATPGDGISVTTSYMGYTTTGKIFQGSVTTNTETINTEGSANAGFWKGALGISGKRGKTKVRTTTITQYPCDNTAGNVCQPYYVCVVTEN